MLMDSLLGNAISRKFAYEPSRANFSGMDVWNFDWTRYGLAACGCLVLFHLMSCELSDSVRAYLRACKCCDSSRFSHD